MDRRGSGRVEMGDEASMFTKDGYFTAVLENISMGGLFLRTNKPIEVGERIEITIPLPEHQGRNEITVHVTAIRVMPNGVAFTFNNIDDDTYSALLHLTSSAHA